MKLLSPYLVIIAALIFVQSSFSQDEDDSDLENWSSISLKYKLNKKLSFELEQQLRLDENISEVSEYFTQLNTEYYISKRMGFGVGLRYIRENDNEGNIQGYENHFRFNIDALYKHKIDAFSLKFRMRYQNKNELGLSSDEGDESKQNIRFKTAVEYDINNWKLDPKISAEIFNPIQQGEDNKFSKYRLTIGTDYKIKNFGKIGLFYRFQKELNVDVPETTNIIGFKYAYSFKNK